MPRTKYTYNEKRKEWITQVFDGTYTPDGRKHRKTLSSKKSSADLEKKVAAFKQTVAESGASAPAAYTFGEYARICPMGLTVILMGLVFCYRFSQDERFADSSPVQC